MKDTFKQHPKIKSYFTTSDGVKFFRKSDAKNHARTLDNKTVEEVQKGQSAKSDAKTNSDSKKKSAKKTANNGGANKGAKKLTPMQEAKIRKEAIEKLDTVEAVEKALEGETAKSVKEAGAKRIEAIKAATTPSEEEE